MTNQPRALLFCCGAADLSAVGVDEVKQGPDGGQHQLLAPAAQTWSRSGKQQQQQHNTPAGRNRAVTHHTMDRWSVETQVLGTAVAFGKQNTLTAVIISHNVNFPALGQVDLQSLA